jgi:hypothetical protein
MKKNTDATKKDMISLIKEVVSKLKDAEKKIFSYTSNKNIPLNTRWEVFVEACKNNVLPPPSGWVEHWDLGGQEISLYDDLYIDRYADVWYYSMIETFEENISYEGHDETYTQEDIDDLKQRFLQEKKTGFNNDW